MSVCISAVTVVVDMTVDFFLIYGIGPVPALGVNGSAYSTIAVEAIALVWCLIWSSRKQEVRLDRKSLFFFSADNEKDAWRIIPAGGDSRYDAVSVFFATWCFAIPLSLLGYFVFQWPVIIVYFVMCLDEIVKAPFIPHRYKRYLWLNNLTRARERTD